MKIEEFSKYERARILGARALQISMDAPILIKLDEKKLNELNYDSLKIAEIELDSGIIPISIKRPMPKKKEERLDKVKIEDLDVSEDKIIEQEKEEEREIAEKGEIMGLANPEDEQEDLIESVDNEITEEKF